MSKHNTISKSTHRCPPEDLLQAIIEADAMGRSTRQLESLSSPS